MSNFTVTIEDFEGPIDALLQMIEKRKMPINDISLSRITDEYVTFIQQLEDDSLSNKTHFIFVASTLILIKSKSLLPGLDLTDEEEEDIETLKQRIALLKQYQYLGGVLGNQISARPQFYFSQESKKVISFLPPEDINPFILRDALKSLFHELPEVPQKKQEGYITIAVHIEEMMDSLESRIQHILSTTFDTFIGNHIDSTTSRKQVQVYKVVGFLALLELVKNGILNVLQEKNFTEITIERS